MKRKRESSKDFTRGVRDRGTISLINIGKDCIALAIEFMDTNEWIQFSAVSRNVNDFKFVKRLMCNKEKTLREDIGYEEIVEYWKNAKGTLFNVNMSSRYITDDLFQYLEGIHTLLMDECDYDKITDKAFSHLTGIHTLDMSNIRQATITDKAFSYLTGIHTLLMSYGDQLTITDKAFSYLSGVHTLDISYCNQSTITDQAFSYLTGIHSLDMSGCTQITDRAFAYLSGIHTLYMRYCYQESITDKAFSYLTGIHTLDMTGCSQDTITDKTFTIYLKGVRNLCTDESTP